MSLSSLIVQREIATIRQVEEALARQVLYGGDLVTNILEVAKLDEALLTMLLAESFGLAAATLGPLPAPSEQAKGLITADMASARAMVPLALENNALVVAVAEPLPKDAEEELAFALGFRVVQRIAPMVRVREALARTYGAPLERRLQRLLARLGTAAPSPPVEAPLPSAPPAPPAPEPLPPSARAPFEPSQSPAMGAGNAAPAPATVRARQETQIGLQMPVEFLPPVAPPAGGGPPAGPPPTTLVQREAAAVRPARRRRGPIVPEAAVKELEEASTRDAILDLFFDYCRQYFDYTALFVVQSDIAEGREAFGDGASRDRVQAIGVPLDLPSVLAAARDAGAAVRVKPAADGLDEVLLGDLQRKTKGEVLVVPVVVRKRSVALLYGDSGDDGVDPDGVKEVVSFSLLVGQAFEKLIVRKKVQGAIAAGQSQPGGRTSAPPPAVRERTPPPPAPVPAPVFAPPPAPAVPHAPTLRGVPGPAYLPAPLPDPTPPPPSAVAAFFEDQERSAENAPIDELLAEQTPTPALPRVIDLLDLAESEGLPREYPAEPPPENTLRVSRPMGPPIPREEPSEAPPSSRPSSAPPPSASFAVAPHRPPTSRTSEHLALPSVIVDVDEEFGALVDRVITMGLDEASEAELLRQGQKAMPAIMSRFPGPTVVDRARVEEGSLRAADCGPVLRLIAGQRRAALPFVLPIVGDGDPQRRYWATFLMTELAYPDVVDSVVPRLFDPDASVRRVAKLAARAVGEVAPEALMERLVRFYRDPSLSEDRRIEMIETLGELRERLAVPLLIDALNDPEELVAAAARKGLIVVTRQDLGRDARKWQAWWAANGGRHRLEWLIDALMHEVPAIRRAAGDELKAITKEYFGYYDDLPRKERELAQLRYRDWWRNEGRARYQRR